MLWLSLFAERTYAPSFEALTSLSGPKEIALWHIITERETEREFPMAHRRGRLDVRQLVDSIASATASIFRNRQVGNATSGFFQ